MSDMSREEAIKILKGDNLNRCSEKENKALDMAISALEHICDNDCEHCTWTECPINERQPDDNDKRQKYLCSLCTHSGCDVCEGGGAFIPARECNKQQDYGLHESEE